MTKTKAETKTKFQHVSEASWLLLILICHCIVWLDGSSAQEAAIKIGVSVHLTGDSAREGNAMLEGAQLAALELNQDRESKQVAIELIAEDNQSKPATSAAAAKKLIHIDNVKAAVISSLTEARFSGLEFVNNKIPLIVLWDSAPELEEMGGYVFGIGPWAPGTGERVAQFAHAKLHAKSAMVLHHNSRWSETVAGYFTSKFRKLGGEVAGVVGINPDEIDFRLPIIKIRQAHPQAVYAPIEYNLVPFLRQYYEARLGIPLLMSDMLTNDVLRAAGASAEDVYHSQLSELHAPLSQHLQDLYLKEFKREPDLPHFNAWGYDAIRLLAHAIRQAAANNKSVVATLHEIRDYPGASAKISFTRRGSSPMFSSMFQVKKGGMVACEN